MSHLNGFTLKKVYFKDTMALAEVWARYILKSTNVYKVHIEKEKETPIADANIKPFEIENSVAEHGVWFSEPAAFREIWRYSPFEENYMRNSLKWKESHTPLKTNQGS